MAFWNRKKPAPAAAKAKTDIYEVLNGSCFDTGEQLHAYIQEKGIPLPAPVPTNADGQAMDGACAPISMRGAYESINPVLLAYFIASGQFIGYQAMAIIAQNWLIRKGCEAKPRDAVRKWYNLECEGATLMPEQIRSIEQLDRRYKLKNNLIEAATFNNVFGIRHVFFKNTNPDFDYSKPFNPDEFRNGQYAGMAQIDPNRLSPEFENNDLMDPASINYLVPTWWNVNGKRIHKSHMVILTGDMVPDMLKPNYRYGGISKVQKAYERVHAAEATANEAPKLTMTKRLTWRKADLDQVAAKPGKFAAAMQKLVEFRNNFGVLLLGKDEEIGNLDTTLSDLDAVIMGQYQIVCSIFDVPASKMMGTGHSGFSTGETDNDYYIESLEELQANELTDLVDAHYRRLIPAYASDLGISPDATIHPDWLPLKVMSASDIAAVNLQNRQADQIAFTTQAIDNYELRQRLINDPYSGFDNLEMPEEAEEETDEVLNGDQA